MKAAVYSKYGSPEVVSIREIKKPKVRPNEVLIQVFNSTTNRTDTGFRSAEFFISRLFSGLFQPKNQVLGCEFAGKIIEVGEGVTLYKKGDRVFGYDDKNFGGHAEFKVISQNSTFTLLPEGKNYVESVALTEGSHYALNSIRSAKIKKGDQVLVYGATGAIGSAAVQLLKFFGAYVVAVASSRHLGLVKSLGADEVIDYKIKDYKKVNHKFDFIFDTVGKISFGDCKNLLKVRGIFISTELGKRWENIFLAILTSISSGKKVLFPIPKMTKEDLIFLKNLSEEGRFSPVIDRIFLLENIVEAHRYVDSGMKTGNVLITIKGLN